MVFPCLNLAARKTELYSGKRAGPITTLKTIIMKISGRKFITCPEISPTMVSSKNFVSKIHRKEFASFGPKENIVFIKKVIDNFCILLTKPFYSALTLKTAFTVTARWSGLKISNGKSAMLVGCGFIKDEIKCR